MKPKDLLAHLEKGDRTMHHLTKKPQSGLQFTGTLSGGLDQAFQNAFNVAFGQSLSAQTQASTTAGNVVQFGGNQMVQRTGLIGGITKW